MIDVATAEAQAIRDGLGLAERIGCNMLYIKSDSMEIVKVLADPLNHRIVGSGGCSLELRPGPAS